MMTISILLVLVMIPFSYQQCCTKLATGSKKCAECPTGYHLFRGSCLFDVDNCDAYADGFDCSKCKAGFNVVNGTCVAIPPPPPPPPPTPNNTNNTNTTNLTQQIYGDLKKDDNLMILVDYSRSIQKDLETADELFGFVRKFPNGTEYTVVQYETKAPKFYEVVAQFDKKLPLVFKLIGIKQLSTKPTGPNRPDPTPPIPTPPQVVIPTPPPFKVLNADDRQKDKGYRAVEALQRSVNIDRLGNNPVVVAAFYQVTGLNAEYRIFYESTDKKSIFEGRSIYQAARDRVFNVSFSRTTFR